MERNLLPCIQKNIHFKIQILLLFQKIIIFLGDNRDCSKDSRFLSSVGYVHKDNLVGKAQFIFFSSDRSIEVFFHFGNGTNH